MKKKITITIKITETINVIRYTGIDCIRELPRPKGRGFLLRDITSRSQNF